MNSKTEVVATKFFLKQLKQLYKKYPSIKNDLTQLNEKLLKEPKTGTPLGNNAFKIRLAIKSKAQGKSGGARVISYVETEIIGILENTTVNLLTIYDKSEVASISKEEILALIENIQLP
jgi:mRNA-degrading endonuclease RelE of RelBE toxin-antitoxin system